MGAKGARVCGTRQRAVRQQGQVVGIKGSKAGGRCWCSDKSQKTESPKRSQQAGIWVTRLVQSMTPPCLPEYQMELCCPETCPLSPVSHPRALPGPPSVSHSELPQGRGGGIIVPETVFLPGGLMSESKSNIPAKMAMEGDGRSEAEG